MPALGTKKDNPLSEVVRIPLTVAQREAVERAAAKAGIKMTEWGRAALMAALEEDGVSL